MYVLHALDCVICSSGGNFILYIRIPLDHLCVFPAKLVSNIVIFASRFERVAAQIARRQIRTRVNFYAFEYVHICTMLWNLGTWQQLEERLFFFT